MMARNFKIFRFEKTWFDLGYEKWDDRCTTLSDLLNKGILDYAFIKDIWIGGSTVLQISFDLNKGKDSFVYYKYEHYYNHKTGKEHNDPVPLDKEEKALIEIERKKFESLVDLYNKK